MKFTDEYLAGIFDGEGCFSVNNSLRKGYSQRVFQPVAAVGIKQRYICEAFRKRFGGFVRGRTPKNPNHSSYWVWIVTGPSLLKFCIELSPRLKIKKKVCEVVRRFQLIKVKIGNQSPTPSLYAQQEVLYKKLRSLNQRGPKENNHD